MTRLSIGYRCIPSPPPSDVMANPAHKPHWMKATRESDCGKCKVKIQIGDDFFFAAPRLYVCKKCMRGGSTESGKMPATGAKPPPDAPTLTLRGLHNLLQAVISTILAYYPETEDYDILIRPIVGVQLELRRRENFGPLGGGKG